MKTAQTFAALYDYQQYIVASLKNNMDAMGPKTIMRDACEYALMNEGKRIRPALVLMIAQELGYGADVTQAALAIEYFHTASLVVDDLPCMDDDDMRRNKPSVHKAFGEAAALLVSYALIAAGYGCIAQNARIIKNSTHPFASISDTLAILVLENAGHNTGLRGATGGQYLDICPPDLNLPLLREVIHKKTVSLFEISFVSGWLFGGGAPEQIDLVKQAASHFGMAFQIADDLGDVEQDEKNGRKVNMASVIGRDAARNLLSQEVLGYTDVMRQLKLDGGELLSLASQLLN